MTRLEDHAMDDTRHPRHVTRGVSLLAVTLLLALPPGAHAAALGAKPAAAQKALADATLHGLDGHDLKLDALKGHVVVLNFWASWCAPCRKELPQLDQLNTELKASGGQVVAISIDSDAGNARRFALARALGMAVVVDGPDDLARVLDLQQVPTTLVLDRDGSIACAVSGSSDASLAQVTDTARRLCAHPPVATTGPEPTP